MKPLPRPRFRIHHLLYLIALIAIALFLGRTYRNLEHARQEYESQFQAWLLDMIVPSDVVSASEHLYRMEAASWWISDAEAKRRHISRLKAISDKGKSNEFQMTPFEMERFNETDRLIQQRIDELSKLP